MNILPINNNSNTNFNGRILTIGHGWNEKIKNAFVENSEIKKLAEGKVDIIGKLRTRRAEYGDFNHCLNEPLYKFDLMVGKSKSPIINKIAAYLGILPKVKMVRGYHGEDSFISRLNNRPNAEQLKSRFKI